jgi:iron complex outermembrane receptor protein
MKPVFSHGLLLVALCSAAAAQEAEQSSGEIEEVVVQAHPLSAEGLAQAVLVLEGEALMRNVSANVAETLARQPGIHNSSFGNAAGRPVIRGLGGPRVRVMEDRLDTLDVSVTSADHATTVDALVADRIEVLKGPSTLVYGSGAIGGVVDVHTGRIPHSRQEVVSGGVEARVEDATEQVSTVGELDFGAGPMAFHVDGFYRDADEYEIPGCVESDVLREAEGGEPCEVDGTLPGSDLETWGGAGGVSYVGARGFAGFAVSHYENDYGLPGGHGHEEEEDGDAGEAEAEGNPVIELEQTRYELEAGLEDPFAGFSSANLRVVYNDYEHEEVEPDGEVATRFDNEAWDTRLELSHEAAAGFEGTVGLQYTYKEFSAVGEEAFIDPVDTTLLAAFWVGQRPFSSFDLETGLRAETVEHETEGFGDDDFSLFSASVGVVVPFGTGWKLGLQTDYSERAPVPEELYSFGAHLATRAFEIGDPDLDEERAVNFGATLDYTSDAWRLNAAVYYASFTDFIFDSFTGVEDAESGLPILQFSQEDADFYGLDLSAGVRVATFDAGEVWLTGLFDYVDAELDVSGNDNLPRLPPWRVGVGAETRWRSLTARIDYLFVDEQDDVTEFELPTDDYEDLRIFVGTTLALEFGTLDLFVQGKNLTDDEQRYHTSFIKDFAPQPGRTFEGGIRMTF